MEFDIISLLKEVGPATALLLYFVWKDSKFTARLTELIGKSEALHEQVLRYLERQEKHAGKDVA